MSIEQSPSTGHQHTLNPERASSVEKSLRLRDLTDPAAGPHAIQLVVRALEERLAAAWRVGVRRDPGPRVVTVADNYDRLRYGAEAVTRDRRYTRYVDSGRMLRSHTTARIPALLDDLATQPGGEDVLLSVPGICYRRDAIGRRHVGEPHQLDLWLIRRQGAPVTDVDLREMIGLVVTAVLPGRRWYTVDNVHPYTLEGREIYVESPGGPVEVGECGLAHPEVLRPGMSGLAMGLGLDRLVMLAKGLEDIRLLRSLDERIASQMADLTPYRPVSTMPAARRDLSVAVESELDSELLGDRVREVLGPDAAAVEEVSVLSETPYADLPGSARARMGVRPGQKNLLVRIVLRDLERTLTAVEANALRDRVYAGLHRGESHEWTAHGSHEA
jgi:phenylalanyl-tRNA synthetase alpha chain